MNGTRTGHTALATLGLIAGSLVGLYCAAQFSTQLNWRDDPAGTLGSWICFGGTSAFLGWVVGWLTGHALGGRSDRRTGRGHPTRS